MKRIETQKAIEQFLKSTPESAQETICGGGNRPAGGGGGGDIIVFDVIDSSKSKNRTVGFSRRSF